MSEFHFGVGVHDITDEAYHADPCPQPSLSSSIGKILIDQSPLHAWHAHPRLNPEHEADDDDKFDTGKVGHKLILGRGPQIAELDFKDWRTNDAKAAKQAAREAGQIPVLKHNMPAAWAMADAARRQLAHHADAKDAFTKGLPEQTIIWREGPVWCRLKLDWLNKDLYRPFDDLKTTTTNANPDAFERQIFSMGYDFQAAFYRRGIRKVLGVEDPTFRFIVVESKPPHGLSVIELGPAALDLADRRVQKAIDDWAWCMEHDAWPCYPARTVRVDPPVWRETQQLEREDRDQAIREQTGKKAVEFMNTFHRPV